MIAAIFYNIFLIKHVYQTIDGIPGKIILIFENLNYRKTQGIRIMIDT